MKILDRYILTTYLKTFLSVFIILVLIFVLQTIWLYIKELAGKDLDIGVIIKFILYFLPKLMPLVLPLTILLTSIMVFGNFAENYEFAAMKSTGISLQRAMSGLSVFIVLLAITTFFFSNNVIPWAEYNSYNLRKNIAKLKPAMAIAEGQFNEIGTYNIKVEKKSGDRGQFLEDVIIHIKDKSGLKNTTTIVSKTGELVGSEDSDILKLILFDGNYYNDLQPRKIKERKKHPAVKSAFEKYIINIDLSQFNNVDIEDKSYTNKYNMLDISDLDYTIDSLTIEHDKTIDEFSRVLFQRSSLKKYVQKEEDKKNLKKTSAASSYTTDIEELEPQDETIKTTEIEEEEKQVHPDSVYVGNVLEFFNDKKKTQYLTNAISVVNSAVQVIKNKQTTLKPQKVWYNKHIIAFHEKLALGFACIILFFVGAPLGALIRKGGIGLPMVIAILLFLTYHFIGIFAMNSAKAGNFNPVLASWFSTLIMLPLGVYLTKKATADRPLFETEGLLEPLKKLFGIKKKEVEIDTSIFEPETNEHAILDAYDEKGLIKVIKNYRQYGYSRTHRNTAVSILNSRGITDQQLKFSGNFDNQKFEEGIRLKLKFDEDSKLAFILYAIAIPLIIIGQILENNTFPILGISLFVVGLIIGVIYLFALIKSFISSSNLNKHLGIQGGVNALVYLLFGLPLYFIFYLYQKKATSEALYLNRKKTFIKSDQKDVPKAITAVDLPEAAPKLKDYKEHTTFAIILYTLGVIFIVLFFVFKNNKLPSLQSASIQLSIVSLILFTIYYLKSIFNLNAIYKFEVLKEKKPQMVLLLLGWPLYFITYILLKKKIKSDIS